MAPSIGSIYQHQEDRCNFDIVEMTIGVPTITLDDHWDFSRLAIIDGFVQKVLETDEPGYIATTGINGRVIWLRQPWVEPYYRSMTSVMTPMLYEHFDVRNVFVDLFLHACSELQIDTWHSYVLAQPGLKANANAIAFNALIETIRHLATQRPFPSRIWHARNDWKASLSSCERFVEKLFTQRSRYAVVRVDLAYLKEHAFDVFTADARADMSRLLKHIRCGKKRKQECRERDLFANLAGYIWKLEYGTDRLLHFHCFFFFREKNGRQAGYWAQEIGKYWVDVITQGRGTIENCNFHWYRHADEGIGEVNRNDSAKRENLQRALAYLFKAEQCLPIRKSDPRWRTFGKGMLLRTAAKRD
jgi:hypothetical protein